MYAQLHHDQTSCIKSTPDPTRKTP